MKYLIAGCFFLLCAFRAQATGFQSLDIPGPAGKPISLAIWYPSLAAPQPRPMGTFTQEVAIDGAIDGAGLPLVLISHGNGGSRYSHLDTALELARAGFIAVALTHPGDNHADRSAEADVLARPAHLVLALDYLLKAWPHKDRIAPGRIGVFGFSSGGFTALVSIGGQPDLKKVFPHCAAHPADYACLLVGRQKEGVAQLPMVATAALHERRIRAAVIAAPALGFTFDSAALRQVDVPIQLWRAADDRILPHPWYAEQVRASLAAKLEYHVVPRAGHFDFLAPCNDKLAAIAPPICASEEGFDRSAFHQRFNAEVIGFFKRVL